MRTVIEIRPIRGLVCDAPEAQRFRLATLEDALSSEDRQFGLVGISEAEVADLVDNQWERFYFSPPSSLDLRPYSQQVRNAALPPEFDASYLTLWRDLLARELTVQDLLVLGRALHPVNNAGFRVNAAGIARMDSSKLKFGAISPDSEAVVRFLWLFNRPSEPTPLLRAIMVWAAFLFIHPFVDGNGRVARALAQLALRRSGLLTRPWLWLGPTYYVNSRAFCAALLETNVSGKWVDLIDVWLNIVERQIGVQRAVLVRRAVHGQAMQMRS